MVLFTSLGTAQFTFTGEFKPRTEYRHGFGSIIPKDADPGFSIATRFRLNGGYEFETVKFYFSLQDVLVWGENRQLKPEDSNNSFSVFEAWAAFKITESLTTKVGRQQLVYDDERILGGVDWAMQARNHDAALITYSKSSFKADMALAFNQDFSTTTGNPNGFQSQGTTFNTLGLFTYKTMQMLHVKHSWNTFSASALILNNGFQNFRLEGEERVADGLSNLATLGTHMRYKKGIFNAFFNGYFQTGERQNRLKVKNAFLLGLDMSFKLSETVVLGAGSEVISGNDGTTEQQTEAFFPLYGTNHKFNGFMDYFYVGNHANSVGLVDFHVHTKLTLSKRSGLLVKLLNFSGEKALPSGEKALGTEVDIVYSLKHKNYALAFGYSQMFPNDGMYELKGVAKADAADIQNWAWVQLVVKPNFLKKKDK